MFWHLPPLAVFAAFAAGDALVPLPVSTVLISDQFWPSLTLQLFPVQDPSAFYPYLLLLLHLLFLMNFSEGRGSECYLLA